MPSLLSRAWRERGLKFRDAIRCAECGELLFLFLLSHHDFVQRHCTLQLNRNPPPLGKIFAFHVNVLHPLRFSVCWWPSSLPYVRVGVCAVVSSQPSRYTCSPNCWERNRKKDVPIPPRSPTCPSAQWLAPSGQSHQKSKLHKWCAKIRKEKKTNSHASSVKNRSNRRVQPSSKRRNEIAARNSIIRFALQEWWFCMYVCMCVFVCVCVWVYLLSWGQRADGGKTASRFSFLHCFFLFAPQCLCNCYCLHLGALHAARPFKSKKKYIPDQSFQQLIIIPIVLKLIVIFLASNNKAEEEKNPQYKLAIIMLSPFTVRGNVWHERRKEVEGVHKKALTLQIVRLIRFLLRPSRLCIWFSALFKIRFARSTWGKML